MLRVIVEGEIESDSQSYAGVSKKLRLSLQMNTYHHNTYYSLSSTASGSICEY